MIELCADEITPTFLLSQRKVKKTIFACSIAIIRNDWTMLVGGYKREVGKFEVRKILF